MINPVRNQIIKVLNLLGLYFVVATQLHAAEVERFLRVNRPFREGLELFEAAFYSKIPASTPSARFKQIFTDEQIAAEISASEEWKFSVFDERKFLRKEGDETIVSSIRSIEALLKHDEIIVIYQWEPYVRTNFRHPIAMVAFKRLTRETHSTLLFEDLNHLVVERPEILETEVPEHIPHHWNPLINQISKVKRYFGDILQINSLVVDRTQGRKFLNYLYGLAYWHGLLTTGRTIAEGEVAIVGEKEIRGPAVLVPTYYMGEGYGIRGKVYERLNFQRLPIDGKTEFASPKDTGRLLSIMYSDWNHFAMELPQILIESLAMKSDEFPVFMGPLAVVPMELTGPRVAGTFELDPNIEKVLRKNCSWVFSLSRAADPVLGMPLQFKVPKASFKFVQ